MLRIWMGRANTGKTARVLQAIQEGGEDPGALLLCPEHASHRAEMELCRALGPGAARCAQVLSLRLLAGRVLERTEGLTDGTLDAGGKLLLMHLSLQEVLPQLTVYARPSRKAPFLRELVAVCEELIASRVQPEDLGDVCPLLEGMSGEKVRDLALIYTAYLSRLCREGEDRRDLMEKLVERLEASKCSAGKDVYLDGFTYFTAQEMKLIEILLRTARSVTVTLLGDGSGLEIFEQSVRARDRLVPGGAGDRPGAPDGLLFRPLPPVRGGLRGRGAVPGGEHVRGDGVRGGPDTGAGPVRGLPLPGRRRGGPEPGRVRGHH